MQDSFFILLQRARTRPKKSGPACNTQHGKQDSGSKSFEVVSWPQLGPYENNSIHPLLPKRTMQDSFFILLQRARTRPQKSGPACNTQHGKQDSGSKSFEVVSLPQLGPYENNSIHPLLPVSLCFCNVPEQGPRNRAPRATLNMASKTQDQSLLKLYHGSSSDRMRIIQFIRSCPKGLCKTVSSFFCNVPEQGPRNRAPRATLNMASKTQDQSLLKLYHCRSSDLMRIIQFIRSCPFLYVSATCQNKAQEIGPRVQHSTWQARLRIKVFWSCIMAAARTVWE